MFIWGTKGYGDFLGYIIDECSECGKTSPFAVEQVKKKFTVYFVPTFSYSNKQFATCTSCGASFEVPKDLKPEVAKNLITQEELSSLIRQANEDAGKQEGARISGDSTHKINYCPSCGNKVDEEINFCPQCGEELLLDLEDINLA